MLSYRNILLTLQVIFLFFFISVAYAQNVPISLGGLDISASTNYARPGQKVTLTAKSYSIEIDSAKIVWKINGSTVDQGVGLTSIEVDAPALGKKLSISVTATTPGGAIVGNTMTLTSGSVDMLIETGGYVPPFFRGKVGLAYQNSFKIIAIPHIADSSGNEYDPKSLVYEWKRNGTVYNDQSGYGKQSLNLTGDIVPRSFMVTVTVTTRDGQSQVAGNIVVNPNAPFIGFYENDSLYGPLFNRAISKNILIGAEQEKSVLAVPFGFNKPRTSLGNLKLAWSINDIEHPELAENNVIILRAPEKSQGSSKINLRIQNSKDFLEQAEQAFSAIFNSGDSKEPGTSII